MEICRGRSRGPVGPTERALAPDVARGVALLGSRRPTACCTSTAGCWGPGFRPVEAGSVDRVVDGDILTVYGLLGLALVPLIEARARTLAWLGAGALVFYVTFSAPDGLADVETAMPLPLDPTTVLGALGPRTARVAFYLVVSPVVVLAFLTPAVVGMLLACSRPGPRRFGFFNWVGSCQDWAKCW